MRVSARHAAYGQPCSRVHVAGRRAGTGMQRGIMKSCYLIHSGSYLFSFVLQVLSLSYVFSRGFRILMRIRIQHFVRIRNQVSTLNLIVTWYAAYGQPCSQVHVAGRKAGTIMQRGIIKTCYLIHSLS